MFERYKSQDCNNKRYTHLPPLEDRTVLLFLCLSCREKFSKFQKKNQKIQIQRFCETQTMTSLGKEMCVVFVLRKFVRLFSRAVEVYVPGASINSCWKLSPDTYALFCLKTTTTTTDFNCCCCSKPPRPWW